MSYDTQKSSEGKFYSSHPLKYPLKMGLSGHLFENDIEMVALNDPRNNGSFQPEIDNKSNSPAVKNIIIGKIYIERV